MSGSSMLNAIKPINAHREHVVPNRNDPKQLINSQTENAALKRIGYGAKLVAYGSSSVANTALNEASFNPDAIEAVLTQIGENEVRRCYYAALILN